MPRPRSFDEEEVVEKAMNAFWRLGYEGTSIAELEQATGLSRISLYNAFGDKDGLFQAAQRKYLKRSIDYIGTMLRKGGDSAIFSILDELTADQLPDSNARYGCMMANTALDAGKISEAALANVHEFHKQMVGLYRTYLTGLRQAGQLQPETDPKAAAEHIVTSFWGAMTVNRLFDDPKAANRHIEVLRLSVLGWMR